jgi:heptosyltransferase-3
VHHGGALSDNVRAMFDGPKDAIDLSRVRRALVVKLRHHGDVLLASPVFSALKAAAPHLEIDALVYEDTRDMLSGHPAIAQVHGIDRAWKRLSAAARLAREWTLFSALRARRYDLLLHLTEQSRGAWLARGLGVRYAVAPRTNGKSSYWKNSFTHLFAQPLNARRHMVEWNLDALRRIGVQPAPAERRLILLPGAEAETRVLAAIDDLMEQTRSAAT